MPKREWTHWRYGLIKCRCNGGKGRRAGFGPRAFQKHIDDGECTCTICKGVFKFVPEEG